MDLKTDGYTDKINIIDKKGQTFVEFLFLLLTIMSLSYALMSGVNLGIGKRWEVLIRAISSPTPDNINIR